MGEFNVALKPVAAACEKAIETAALVRAEEAMKVRTPGGVFTVRWDEGGSATGGLTRFCVEPREQSVVAPAMH